MYQKFIQYAMLESDALSIYSMKSNPFEQEKCVVELLQGEGRVKYTLNLKTRKFEEQRERKANNLQRKTKKLATELEDEER